MSILLETHIVFPTVLLLIAAVLDVLTGKFPNSIFIASLILGVFWLWSQSGMEGAMKGFAIATLVFIALTPLVFTKALGAGDIKLLAAFSLFTSWQITAAVFLYSLVWGLIMGLSRIFFAGEAKNFFLSLALRNPQVKSQKIPYTVAILMGWLSYLWAGGLS